MRYPKVGRSIGMTIAATPDEKARIDRAARAAGLTRTDMVHRIFRDWGDQYDGEHNGDDQSLRANRAHSAHDAS